MKDYANCLYRSGITILSNERCNIAFWEGDFY